MTMQNKIRLQPKLKKWLQRFGLGGFLFFLLKGIVWLVIGYVAIR